MKTIAAISAFTLAACAPAGSDAPPPPSAPPVEGAVEAPLTPMLPAGNIEDIDFQSYSQDLARFVGLEMGESRLDSTDKIRLYFAPEKGSDIVKLTSSTFERDDGAVLIFARNEMPDDSVKAQEVYAVFSGPGGDAKFNQTLSAYGMRIKCYRGENTTEWQTDLCP